MQTEKAKSSHFDRMRGFKNQIFPTFDNTCKTGSYYRKDTLMTQTLNIHWRILHFVIIVITRKSFYSQRTLSTHVTLVHATIDKTLYKISWHKLWMFIQKYYILSVVFGKNSCDSQRSTVTWMPSLLCGSQISIGKSSDGFSIGRVAWHRFFLWHAMHPNKQLISFGQTLILSIYTCRESSVRTKIMMSLLIRFVQTR